MKKEKSIKQFFLRFRFFFKNFVWLTTRIRLIEKLIEYKNYFQALGGVSAFADKFTAKPARRANKIILLPALEWTGFMKKLYLQALAGLGWVVKNFRTIWVLTIGPYAIYYAVLVYTGSLPEIDSEVPESLEEVPETIKTEDDIEVPNKEWKYNCSVHEQMTVSEYIYDNLEDAIETNRFGTQDMEEVEQKIVEEYKELGKKTLRKGKIVSSVLFMAILSKMAYTFIVDILDYYY